MTKNRSGPQKGLGYWKFDWQPEESEKVGTEWVLGSECKNLDASQGLELGPCAWSSGRMLPRHVCARLPTTTGCSKNSYQCDHTQVRLPGRSFRQASTFAYKTLDGCTVNCVQLQGRLLETPSRPCRLRCQPWIYPGSLEEDWYVESA